MPADVSALEGAKLFERFSNEGELVWGLFSYENAGGKQRVFTTHLGDTNLDGLKAALKKDQIQFGILKVMGVDPKGAVVSRRAKFVFFTWTGPESPRMKRVQVR